MSGRTHQRFEKKRILVVIGNSISFVASVPDPYIEQDANKLGRGRSGI